MHVLQYSRVQRPNIIPGKVPRTTFDSSIPEDGRFTALNAHLSAKPLNVRQREAYDLDLLQPGEQPQVLSQRDLKTWWEARANGTLSDNPQTEEEVLASQRTFADELLEKRYKKISGVRLSHNPPSPLLLPLPSSLLDRSTYGKADIWRFPPSLSVAPD